MKKIPVPSNVFGLRLITVAISAALAATAAAETFRPQVGEHVAHRLADRNDSHASTDDLPQSVVVAPQVVMAPTHSSFLAQWNAVSGATGYRLDVSADRSFADYIDGYRDLDTGAATNRIVSGLNPGTTYYYRVRSYGSAGVSSASDVMTASTITAPGLVITPTFDSSILTNPNSAAIQSTINQAVAIYQSLFSDPVNAKILFRFSNTQPNGSPMGTSLALSAFVIYPMPWNTYKNALVADAKTSNDATANGTLPASPLSTNLLPSSAGGRAVGLNTPPAMFPDGTVGVGGPYDGVVTLNSGQPYQFTRPTSGSNFDALRSTQHEMDEVLGLGSKLNITGSSDLRPQDLFSWSAPGTRNLTSSGTRYFSINGGGNNIVGFNQNPTGDFGDWLSSPCPQANPYVQNAFGCRGQSSDIAISSPEGINMDVVGYDLNTSTAVSSLGNISTRLRVLGGDNVLIGGVITTGTAGKRVILRAIGPSLTGLGVPGALADTTLDLFQGNTLLMSNDDWQISTQQAEIQNSGFAPGNSKEAAIIWTLTPNQGYTAIVRGKNGTTGVGVVEAYDLDHAAASKLGNISTRGFVDVDDNVMIAGLIVTPSNGGTTSILVRALGPTLGDLGVPGFLANPTLDLVNSSGTVIRANSNWKDDPQQRAAIEAAGLAPSHDEEAALVETVAPGAYTAIVRGTSRSTGVGLVEAYNIP